MSRIGKQPIAIPSGVTVSIKEDSVLIEGPKGKLEEAIRPEVTVEHEGESIVVTPKIDDNASKKFWGLTRSLIQNMVEGVTKGFSKRLELKGVGYRVALKGNDVELQLGYSHPILYKAPQGITFAVDGNTKLAITGTSKYMVGQVAANIRALRPPEPYLGKGVRYEGEHVRRKAGKSGKK